MLRRGLKVTSRWGCVCGAFTCAVVTRLFPCFSSDPLKDEGFEERLQQLKEQFDILDNEHIQTFPCM